MKFETLSVHAGRDVERATGAVAPPIQMSTTFERDIDGEWSRGFSYGRADNPSRKPLESPWKNASPPSKAVTMQPHIARARPHRWRSSACSDRVSM
jgi:cystathionine beta-lyase/cystathionine gamma-synthase